MNQILFRSLKFASNNGCGNWSLKSSLKMNAYLNKNISKSISDLINVQRSNFLLMQSKAHFIGIHHRSFSTSTNTTNNEQINETMNISNTVNTIKNDKDLDKTPITTQQIIQRDLQESLLLAASLGHIQTMSKLIEMGAKLSELDEKVFYNSLTKDRIEVVRFLLEQPNGQKFITIKNKTNKTPLFLCAKYGSLEMAKLLIDKGTDVNAIDIFGMFLLFFFFFCSVLFLCWLVIWFGLFLYFLVVFVLEYLLYFSLYLFYFF
jgi:ankyrin repeat protein